VRWRTVLPVLAVTAGLLTGSMAADASVQAKVGTATAGEPLYAVNTGLVLTVGSSAGQGALVRVRADTGSDGQRWVFGSHGTVSPAENQHLCLNVPVVKHRLTTRLNLWACNGAARQQFVVTAPSAHTPVFFLASVAADRKLCVSFPAVGLSTAIAIRGTKVSLRKCGNSAGNAFSTTNLQGVVASISMTDWQRALNANEGSKLGTGVTASYQSLQLGQQWESQASGSYASLSPVYNTSLCLAVSGAQRARAPLVLARCDGSAAQQFIGIGLLDGNPARYFLVSANARFCISTLPKKTAVKAPVPTRSVVLRSCPGKSAGSAWLADMNIPSELAFQFQQFYVVVNDWSGLWPAMATDGGSAGSVTTLSQAMTGAQVWTDVNPATMTAGNADGSISIRPLYDMDLCLTVPSADYTAGVQLQVQACDGAADQEFSRQDSTFNGGAADVFSPWGNGGLCVSYAGALASGDQVELAACDGQVSQAWEGWDAWFDWAG
jgi:Ricin-type beta-trefoil lectin domain